MRKPGAVTFVDPPAEDPPDGPVPIDPAEDVHVHPSAGEHVASMHCWCAPRISYAPFTGGRVWTHQGPS